MNVRSYWILAAALTAAIAIGVAVASALMGDEEYESENRSTSVRNPVLDASNVNQLISNKGKNVMVKGTVHSTHLTTSGKVFILNLGLDYKSCFRVKVFSSDFAKWDGGPDKLKSMYEGKRIGVEGEITIYDNLPEIKVNVPSKIRALD